MRCRSLMKNSMHFLNSQPNLEPRRQRTTLVQAMRGARWQGEIVQMARGKGPNQLDMASTQAVGLAHVRFPHEATVRAEQPRGFVTFSLPLSDERLLRVNGVQGGQLALFVNFGFDETHIYAPRRNLIAGRIETATLLAELSRITGSSLQDDAVPRGLVELGPSTHERLVRALLSYIHDRPPSAAKTSMRDVQVVETMAWALISARQANSRATKALQIVKRTRRLLDTSVRSKPTLAEICSTTGCSAPVLTNAFQHVTGTSPARYVRHLRLAQAHIALLNSDPSNASVKAIALEAGFTELGRFSGLYNRVYGQLPSKTHLTDPRIS